MTTDALISCRGLIPAFADQQYLGEGLDLDIGHGEIIAIIGPDHAGKAEWLTTLGGVSSPQQGRLQLLGNGLEDFDRSDWIRIRTRLAYLDPDSSLLSAANARQNVMLPVRYHQLPREQVTEEDAIELLNRLEVTDQLSLPAYLKRDQRFRIAIARSLILEPAGLLLDTPFKHMGLHARRRFQSFLVDRVRQQDMTLIVATDDIDFVVEQADTALFASMEGIHCFDDTDDIRRTDLYAVKKFLSECRLS